MYSLLFIYLLKPQQIRLLSAYILKIKLLLYIIIIKLYII